MSDPPPPLPPIPGLHCPPFTFTAFFTKHQKSFSKKISEKFNVILRLCRRWCGYCCWCGLLRWCLRLRRYNTGHGHPSCWSRHAMHGRVYRRHRRTSHCRTVVLVAACHLRMRCGRNTRGGCTVCTRVCGVLYKRKGREGILCELD